MIPAILVIDDEPQIRRAVRNALAALPARILEAATGAEGLDIAASERPALIVLDLGLPDMSGADVCRDLRAWSAAPVLVLSARHAEDEKVALLDAGADDYVTKPFATAELRARVRALLRRSRGEGGAADTHLTAGALVMDLRARTLTRAGAEVHLTPTEWGLLETMMTHAGRTLTHQFLYTAVWSGRPYGDAQQHLRVHVAHLRRKIGDDPVRPRHIVTEAGVGYRFVAG